MHDTSFLVDECISPLCVSHLIIKGFNAISVLDALHHGAKDGQIIEFAKKINRILITLDTDFSDIFLYPIGSNPGIIVLRVKFSNIDILNNLFDKYFIPEYIQFFPQCLTIITAENIRIRKY